MPINPQDYRGVDTSSILFRLMQLQDMKAERENRGMESQANAIKLRQLQQQEADQQAVRGAYGAAAQRGRSVPSTIPEMALGGNTLPSTTTTVRGPGIDNAVLLEELAKGAPQMVPQVQAQMQQQQAEQQKQMIEIQKGIQALDKGKLDNLATKMELSGRYLMAFKQAPPELKPRIYPTLVAKAVQDGILQPGMLPKQYSPELEPWIDSQIAMGQKVSEVIQNQITMRGQDLSASTAKRGQDITVRGQNMTDARMREQNQISREGKTELKRGRDEAAMSGMEANMDRLATAANELLNHKGLAGITGVRGAMPNIPGGKAADAEAKLQTLKSQVGFGVLQEMRNQSKTGGALGQVSDREISLLTANLAALDKAQSVEQFKESLSKIVNYANEAKGRARQAFERTYSQETKKPDPLGIF